MEQLIPVSSIAMETTLYSILWEEFDGTVVNVIGASNARNCKI